MNSMTGFGRAELDSPLGRFTVEISGVNNRFLEISVRLPRPLSALEPQIREQISGAVHRGKVSLFVNLAASGAAADTPTINIDVAKAYQRQLKQLRKELKLDDPITLQDLLMLPEVAVAERPEPDLKAAGKHLEKATAAAMKVFLAMRAREGQAMAKDMRKQLKELARLITAVQKASKNSVEVYSKKLTERIDELLNSKMRDSVRLEEEIALFADRANINEECIRFKSHLDQFAAALKAEEAPGRRLNFILQELNREANTIAAKCSDFDISAMAISLKQEIEKLREQVQNVE
ncbi:YicC family protein [candidate division GN15 bacterium]|nr:YicC family protein [candidate division GN15 bacterium]